MVSCRIREGLDKLRTLVVIIAAEKDNSVIRRLAYVRKYFFATIKRIVLQSLRKTARPIIQGYYIIKSAFLSFKPLYYATINKLLSSF
jgi:hypothetical protein